MLRRRFYYAIKPYLPWRLRMGVRGLFASIRRSKCRDIWPIDEAASKRPVDWPGWPNGKDFAFVLTHDVEGQAGLAKCRQLAEFEQKLGFRSSFNFIPEGPYNVPHSQRKWLTENGFEVGVHDLLHDGKLYSSRAEFARKALRINRYLSEWGAVGYRSGFMLRNLDWHHDLNILYDASTFDTDPFEPQPLGARTIYPFWVQAPASEHRKSQGLADRVPGTNGQGYVELPYTLTQDSTMFLLFREKSPDLWFKKLDWIAANGGMALLNLHPDYVRFPGEKASRQTFSVDQYRKLLEYLITKYSGRYWQPLPNELASWYSGKASKQPEQPRKTIASLSAERGETFAGLRGKRAAVLLYSDFPADPRPRRAAQTMVDVGMEVDMFCLGDPASQPMRERIDGVDVYRVPIKHQRSGKLRYFLQYGRFIAAAFWFLLRQSMRRRYDIVHVHNMPDVLVFSAVVAKLRGAKIILDLHDPMPELMMTIYGLAAESRWVSILKRLERWSISFATSVVTVNRACRKIFAARSCPAEKIHVVMNAPDETIFAAPSKAMRPPRPDDSFVIMYHGSLVERHGLDLAVAALGKVKPLVPNAQLRIYGTRNDYLEGVLASDAATALGVSVQYFGAKSQEEIVLAIAECDVGIIPNRRSIFTELNTPTRIFEYLSQGKPVIAPRAPGIQDYFTPDEILFFELGSVEDLSERILAVYHDKTAAEIYVQRGQTVYRQHDWIHERSRLIDVFATCLGGKRSEPEQPADRGAVLLSE